MLLLNLPSRLEFGPEKAPGDAEDAGDDSYFIDDDGTLYVWDMLLGKYVA